MPEAHHSRDVVLYLGHEQITLSQRYELVIRPAIRLTRRIHIQRCGPATQAPADQEF